MVRDNAEFSVVAPPAPEPNIIVFSTFDETLNKMILENNTHYIFAPKARVKKSTQGRLFEAIDRENIEFHNPKVLGTTSAIQALYFERCRNVKVFGAGAHIDLVKGGTPASACIFAREAIDFLVDGGFYTDASRGIYARSPSAGQVHQRIPQAGKRCERVIVRNVETSDFSNEPISVNQTIDCLIENIRAGEAWENPIDIGFNYLSHVRNFDIYRPRWSATKNQGATGIHFDGTLNAVVENGKIVDCDSSAMQIFKAANVEVANITISNTGLVAGGAAVNVIGSPDMRSKHIYLHDLDFTGDQTSDIWINDAEDVWTWNTPGARINKGSATSEIHIDEIPPDYAGVGSMFENNIRN